MSIYNRSKQFAANNGLKLLLVGLCISMTTVELISAASGAVMANNENDLTDGSMDLASTGKVIKGKRSTVLGKAVPSELKGHDELQVLLKDPAISQAWGLKTTAAQRAWRVTTGSRDIVVAIVDTGVDAQHPDLSANLWVNPGETGRDAQGRDKATNGIDDDGNGYVDDVHGWNFVSNNNDLSDNHGHGTHIAGIIGAEGGNGIGISGVAPKVSLMVLKYYDPKAPGANNLSNTVRAIEYAVRMNANIINYSGGGLDPSPEERGAIEKALRKGILFVAAAGNERSNSDVRGYYPADYGLPNIISVTAIDKTQTVLPTSNYGEHTVDIAAPGNNIYSTLPHGQYGFMTGTSQATAFVSGVAALVMSNNPELRKADRVIKYLTQTGDTDEKLNGKTRYRKILNSYNALAIQDKDLSINGVRVENTLHLGANTFVAEPGSDAQPESPESALSANGEANIADFGKALRKAMVAGPGDRAKEAESAASKKSHKDLKTAAPSL